MYIAREKPDVNRVSKCVYYCVNLGISATTGDPDALVLFESLIEFIDFWACFGMVRISLFLHLRLLYEL